MRRRGAVRNGLHSLWLTGLLVLSGPPAAFSQQRADYDAIVAVHAKANDVPEALVHRVILRESGYRPTLMGRNGTIGLMQIKLATARSLGYAGDAKGLRDPDTNLTYAVKYLAGAYRAAKGDFGRAIAYYAGGYYYAAKLERLQRASLHDAPAITPGLAPLGTEVTNAVAATRAEPSASPPAPK